MRKSWLLVAAVVPLVGCGGETTGPGGGGGGGNPELKTLIVEATDSSLVVEQTATLSTKGKDQNGKDITLPSQPTYTVSPTSVATVSGNVVTGANKGTATVTATVGSVTGSLAIAVSGRIHEADITSSETWAAADNPHLVKADIAVNGTASPILTIEAGTEVRFSSGAGLRIGWSDAGAIKVMGTATAPVQFVAHAASPTKGFWRQLLIYNKAAASELHYLTMSYCGGSSGLGTDACLSMVGSGSGNGPKPVVDNVTIQNSGAYGVRVDHDAAFGTGSTMLTVTGSTSNPITIEANEAATIPTGGSFTGNTPNAVRVTGEDVVATQTWANLGIPYVLTSDVNVQGSAAPTLTIPAGTELRFGSGAGLWVGWADGGGLLVQGTQAAPVKLTADAATPAKGHWKGLVIYNKASNATSLTYTTLEYCGGSSGLGTDACVHIVGSGNGQGPVPTLANVTISNSGGYGLRVADDARLSGSSGPLTISGSNRAPVLAEANEVSTLPTGTYTGNTSNVIEVEGEDVTASVTWKNYGIPYRVLQDTYVQGPAAPTLTIPAGTELRFGSGVGLWVGWADGGGLLVQGTQAAPVKFTADAATPAKGHWKGLVIYNKASNATSLTYTTLEYCGGSSGLGTDACVHIVGSGNGQGPVPTLANVTISNSGGYGLRIAGDAKLSGGSGPLTISGSNSAPVWAEANEVSTLPTGTYTGNTDNVIEVQGEDVTASVTWKNYGIPYRILQATYVQAVAAPTLTIEAGSTLRFAAGAGLWVGWADNGGLVAAGTNTAPITFTGQAASAGTWVGIVFYSHVLSGSKLDYAVVEYGGANSGLGSDGNVIVELNGLSSLITNSTIRNSASCGVLRRWQTSGADTDYTSVSMNNVFSTNTGGNQCGPQ